MTGLDRQCALGQTRKPGKERPHAEIAGRRRPRNCSQAAVAAVTLAGTALAAAPVAAGAVPRVGAGFTSPKEPVIAHWYCTGWQKVTAPALTSADTCVPSRQADTNPSRHQPSRRQPQPAPTRQTVPGRPGTPATPAPHPAKKPHIDVAAMLPKGLRQFPGELSSFRGEFSAFSWRVVVSRKVLVVFPESFQYPRGELSSRGELS